MIGYGSWSKKEREMVEKAVIQIKKEHPKYTQREVRYMVANKLKLDNEPGEVAIRKIYHKLGIKVLNQPKPRCVVEFKKVKGWINKQGRMMMDVRMEFVRRDFPINTNKQIELKEY